MAAGFAGLVDASFTFKMAPTGKISDVKTDKMLEKMAKGLPDGPQKDMMVAELKKQFGSDKMAEQLALIWAAHAAFDRAIGWGLKYADSFCNTDMGRKTLPIPTKILS